MVNFRALTIAAGLFGVAFLAAALTRPSADASPKPTAKFPKLAPYDAIRWEAGEPVVRVDGNWSTLVAIDGVKVGDIEQYCRQTYGDRWRKRFEEDLVEALVGMGHTPGETVELVVRDAGETETRTLERVAMTHDKRQAIWHAAQARGIEWQTGGGAWLDDEPE